MVMLKRVIPRHERIPRWVGVLSRDDYVTREEAAFLLGIRPLSVRGLFESGRLAYVVMCGESAVHIRDIARLKQAGYTGRRGHRPRGTHCKRGHAYAEHEMPGGGCRVCARFSVRRRRGVQHQRVWP